MPRTTAWTDARMSDKFHSGFLNCITENWEFKKRRRERQTQCHKSMILLVERGKIIVLHVQHAFWCKFLTQSAKCRREIFIFEVLTTKRARSIRAKKAKVHLASFVQSNHHGIIATSRKVQFQCHAFVSATVVASLTALLYSGEMAAYVTIHCYYILSSESWSRYSFSWICCELSHARV